MKIKRTPLSWVADIALIIANAIVLVVTLYPFIYVLSMSISDPVSVTKQEVIFLPKNFSLGSYIQVFKNPDLFRSYYNTVWYVTVGTAINVIMTVIAAYPLSKKKLFAKNYFMFFITLTMFFNGGLIPSFLLIQRLGLYDTRWALVLSGAVSAWYIIIARTFFQTIPESMDESAKLDGANDILILWKIILPLSAPIIAVLTIFYAVGHWNSYFSAMLYIKNPGLQPLQLYLVKILIENDSASLTQNVDQMAERNQYAIQIKYAIIIISVLPIICIYPFFQKYFVKGVMIGAIKE